VDTESLGAAIRSYGDLFHSDRFPTEDRDL